MTIRDRMLLFYTYEEINIMTKNEFFEAVKENVLDILREEDQGFDGDIKKNTYLACRPAQAAIAEKRN